jgi:phage FluMu protein Com
MPINDVQAFSSQGLRQLRRMNGDGTVTIVCRICSKPLYRGMYQGFSTAKCSDCAGVSTDAVVTGAFTLPDGRVVYEAEQNADAILYTERPEMEKVGLARAVFRALGFGKPKQPKPQATESTKISREKKRKPIFGPGEE